MTNTERTPNGADTMATPTFTTVAYPDRAGTATRLARGTYGEAVREYRDAGTGRPVYGLSDGTYTVRLSGPNGTIAEKTITVRR